MLATKTALYELCLQRVEQMLQTAEQSISQAEEARQSETKSSAGDKFETGRAMAHAEMHKAQRSFVEAKILMTELKSMNRHTEYERIQKGALIETTTGMYFLSIGLGKLNLQDTTYYALSVQSPLGQLFLNKGVGDHITFRSLRMEIVAIH